MYLDVKGLVTTGVGNLIDTPAQAVRLPWRHGVTGPLATANEVKAAWQELKARQDLRKLHWKYAAKLNDLRLTDEAIEALVESKLASNYEYIKKRYKLDLDNWPADALLACMSMAWAVGPGFPGIFKNWLRCAAVGDWNGCSLTCKIRTTNNPGVIPRNTANVLCFTNAAVVDSHDLDREVLYWPEQAEAEEPPEVPDAPVLPPPVSIPWVTGLNDETRDDIDEAKRKHILGLNDE